MKIIKRFLYFIMILVMVLCAAIMVCAFNPSLTNALAARVSGNEGGSESEEVSKNEELPESEEMQGLIGSTENDSAVQTPESGEAISGDVVQDDAIQDGIGNTNEQGGTGVYVPPAQEDVLSPESVKDRNGYEPVWENGEEIADEDAENLHEELQTGETGEDFSFDTLIYPYYGMLGQNMQTLYRQIYANAMNLVTSFSPVVNVSVDEVKDVFEAVYNDHPELFWLETGYSCKYLRNGQCVELTLQYHKVTDNLEEAKVQFEAAAQEIIKGAEELASDVEKEKYVHDALIDKVDYHAGTSMSQSAYSALVSGRSVCAGYARAYQYLMMELDIPCYYCTGYSGEDHAWNIVKLDDGFYNVDVTWDDTKPFTYDYFNKTDADYAQTHMRKGMSVNLPVCNGGEHRKEISENSGEDGNASGEEGTAEDLNATDTDSLINDNPQDPLTWEDDAEDSEDDTDSEDKTDSEAENDEGDKNTQTEAEKKELKELGLEEEDVLDNLEEYYADCLKQMTESGVGYQQFSNVIPKSLWQSIEQIYSDGSYEKGYVDEALKQMNMENFAIQLQTERLNGSYYRLYHNVSTW